MTQTTPPADPAWQAPASAPAQGRPGLVTGAGVTLIVLGVLTLLLGLLLLVGFGLFAGAAGSVPPTPEMPGIGAMVGAAAGLVLVFALIVLAFGGLQLFTGIKALGGSGWTRVTGIVLGVIGGLLALAGVGNENGSILNLALVAANAFVVFALAVSGPWFAARRASA